MPTVRKNPAGSLVMSPEGGADQAAAGPGVPGEDRSGTASLAAEAACRPGGMTVVGGGMAAAHRTAALLTAGEVSASTDDRSARPAAGGVERATVGMAPATPAHQQPLSVVANADTIGPPYTIDETSTLTPGQVLDVTFCAIPGQQDLDSARSGTGLLVLEDATLIDSGMLWLGYDVSLNSPIYTGGLTLEGASVVTAEDLNLFGRMSLDPASAMVIGTGPSIAGAVVIGSDATLDTFDGTISANVVDNGLLNVHDILNSGQDLQYNGTVVIDGSLRGTGTIELTGWDALDVESLTGFAGTVVLAPDYEYWKPRLSINQPPGPTEISGGSGYRPFTIDVAWLGYEPGGMGLSIDGSNLSLSAGFGLGNIVPAGQDASDFIVRSDGSGGTEIIDTACYAAGTRIATATGEVPVEALRPGDLVRTMEGLLLPVRWIGRRRIELARHARPWRVAPVRIAADAIAPGVPARDLFVSPDHALHIAGRLVPAGRLANGATIARQDDRASITYWHFELDHHAIVLAENCPAETYLDTGNRALFANIGSPRPLHPDLCGAPAPAALAIWAEYGAAPLLLNGEALERLWSSLVARARRLGWVLTAQPRPILLADGVRVTLRRTGPGAWRARLPRSCHRLGLRSASFVPAEVVYGSGDWRRLGLAVQDLRLDGIGVPPSAFGAGWHPAEEGFRWTGGTAEILPGPAAKAAIFELQTAPAGAYWRAPRRAEDRQAAPDSAGVARLRPSW